MSFPTGWTKRCPITIAAGTVSEALTDWPLLLTEANLPAEIFTAANADGSDIRASSDEAGTAELAVEVVSFDAGGTAQIWVKVSSVSAVADTTIYLWFGSPTATLPAADSAFGSQAVWLASDRMVIHEPYGNGTTATDSTASGNDGSVAGGSAAAGVIGSAISLSGAANNGVTIDDDRSLDATGQWCVSAWVKLGAFASGYRTIAGKRGAGANFANWMVQEHTSGKLQWGHERANSPGNWTLTNTTGAVLTTAEFRMIHVGYNGSQLIAYVNGELSTGALTTAFLPNPNTRAATIGRLSDDEYFNGLIDEVRAKMVFPSPAWIAADVASQSSPGTFATPGTVATISETTIKINFALSGGAIKVRFTQAE